MADEWSLLAKALKCSVFLSWSPKASFCFWFFVLYFCFFFFDTFQYLGAVTSTIVQNGHDSHVFEVDIHCASENIFTLYTRYCIVDLEKEAVILVLDRIVPVLTEEVTEDVPGMSDEEVDETELRIQFV